MGAIVLDRVTKTFGDSVVAVRDLSLEIADGEFMILVGPSGCGKTTALRLIAGLERISSGDLYIGEERANDVPERERDIAMVFQNYALYPHMTVAQNIGFSLRMAKLDKATINARVSRTSEMLGLTDLLKRKPKQLSGGQRQRVAMGRAIIREPKAFLMDEPLSNLDAQLRVQMRGEIEAIQERLRVTTLYVTHDQVEAMTMGDRIAVMRDGVLQQVGAPEEVYAEPANLFVARFIGSPPMNLATVQLNPAGDGAGFGLGLDTVKLSARSVAHYGLQRFVGRDVVVGVRPADLRLRSEDRGGTPLRASVVRAESLGSDALVFADVAAGEVDASGVSAAAGGQLVERTAFTDRGVSRLFCAVVDARAKPRPGDEIDLTVAAEDWHFFDPTTEAAIPVDGR